MWKRLIHIGKDFIVVTFELVVRCGKGNCQAEQGSMAFWGEESCAGTWNCEGAWSDSRTSEKLGVALPQG